MTSPELGKSADFLHPLVVLIFKEIGDEFGKHRRPNEGEFH